MTSYQEVQQANRKTEPYIFRHTGTLCHLPCGVAGIPVVSICGSIVGSRLWFWGVLRLVSSMEPSRPEESIAELMVESRAGAAEESRSRWELSALPYESSSSEMVKHLP